MHIILYHPLADKNKLFTVDTLDKDINIADFTKLGFHNIGKLKSFSKDSFENIFYQGLYENYSNGYGGWMCVDGVYVTVNPLPPQKEKPYNVFLFELFGNSTKHNSSFNQYELYFSQQQSVLPEEIKNQKDVQDRLDFYNGQYGWQERDVYVEKVGSCSMIPEEFSTYHDESYRNILYVGNNIASNFSHIQLLEPSLLLMDTSEELIRQKISLESDISNLDKELREKQSAYQKLRRL